MPSSSQNSQSMVGVSLAVLETQEYSGITFQFSDVETKLYVYENIMGVLVPCIQELITEITQQQLDNRCGNLTATQRRNQTTNLTNSLNPIDWLASLLMRKNPRYFPESKHHPYHILLQKGLRQFRPGDSPIPSPYASRLLQSNLDGLPGSSSGSGIPRTGSRISSIGDSISARMDPLHQQERDEMNKKKRQEKEAAAAEAGRRPSLKDSGKVTSGGRSGEKPTMDSARRSSQILAIHRGDTPSSVQGISGKSGGGGGEKAAPSSEAEILASWKTTLNEKYELEKQRGIPTMLQWLEAQVLQLNSTASVTGKFEEGFATLCEEVVNKLAITFEGLAASIALYDRDAGQLSIKFVSQNSSA